MRTFTALWLCLIPAWVTAFDDCGEWIVGASMRVAVLQGDGTATGSAYYASAVLQDTAGVTATRLPIASVAEGALQGFDVVIMPGGSATKQFQALGAVGAREIKRFVAEGGGFVGLCAGAYMAGVAPTDYALGLLPVQVFDREHWARGKGLVALQPEAPFRQLSWPALWQYANGPLLAEVPNTGLPAITAVARFKSDVSHGTELAGLMPGSLAIVRGRYGHGNVVAFSPHPELTIGAEKLLFQATLWASSLTKKP